ncbi:uncharacterized protein N7459_006322 [Penicillium hispanicum]|uniref:uncharacterized protein n=1 Tax=Penicillium hispanicum TaxID=1080232 RepID=UPI0025418606|nr:uncharacterized protein N7459_006322 [Penicillium hispanicum]KAJ5580337.1 hypothetical protein N7459_006322 [Penicillium hispanicum]
MGASLVATAAAKPASIGPTEVLIGIKAIAINPADYKMADQGHRVTAWPLVPGLDGAGIVEAVGDQVKRVALGDQVLALFTPGDRAGSYQSFAVVQESAVAKIPPTWALEEAATLGVCYLTAVMALGIGLKAPLPFLQGGPTTGLRPSSVLILGGSSAVGAATIQLMRLSVPECTILATSSSRHHAHLVNSLGVDRAFDRNSVSLVTDVKSATPDSKGVDAIIDAVGAGATERHVFETFDVTGPKKYAQVWTGDEEVRPPAGVDSVLFRGRDLPQLPGNENIMQALEGLLERGTYKLPLPLNRVGHRLEGLRKGLELMRQGVSGEKLVATL